VYVYGYVLKIKCTKRIQGALTKQTDIGNVFLRDEQKGKPQGNIEGEEGRKETSGWTG
jgi:hypothetical protein